MTKRDKHQEGPFIGQPKGQELYRDRAESAPAGQGVGLSDEAWSMMARVALANQAGVLRPINTHLVYSYYFREVVLDHAIILRDEELLALQDIRSRVRSDAYFPRRNT